MKQTMFKEKEKYNNRKRIMKDNVCALMKRIPCKSSQPSYRRVNLNHSLKEILKGTTVIEFPTIEVVLEDDLCKFPVFIEEISSSAKIGQHTSMI